jgi:hypothetical protein
VQGKTRGGPRRIWDPLGCVSGEAAGERSRMFREDEICGKRVEKWKFCTAFFVDKKPKCVIF